MTAILYNLAEEREKRRMRSYPFGFWFWWSIWL